MSEPFDLNNLLNQAMEMQQQLLAAQAEAAQAEVTGRSGGGAVSITVTGAMQFTDVTIRPDAVDPDDVAMLQDLVLAALNDAMAQLAENQQSSLGDLDMGALGGLVGGGAGDPAPGDLGALAGGLPGGEGLDLGALLGGVTDVTDVTDVSEADEPDASDEGGEPDEGRG